MLRRYLRTYGPATLQDFKYWRGSRAPMRSAGGLRWSLSLATVAVGGSEQSILRADIDELLVRRPTRWQTACACSIASIPFCWHTKTSAGWCRPRITSRSFASPATSRASFSTAARHRHLALRAQGRGLTIVVEPLAASPGAWRKEERIAPRIAAYFDVPLQEIVEQPFFARHRAAHEPACSRVIYVAGGASTQPCLFACSNALPDNRRR